MLITNPKKPCPPKSDNLANSHGTRRPEWQNSEQIGTVKKKTVGKIILTHHTRHDRHSRHQQRHHQYHNYLSATTPTVLSYKVSLLEKHKRKFAEKRRQSRFSIFCVNIIGSNFSNQSVW